MIGEIIKTEKHKYTIIRMKKPILRELTGWLIHRVGATILMPNSCTAVVIEPRAVT